MAKVMLIDDSIFTLKSYGDLVSNLGYEVITAESGDEAVQLFAKHRPDIVLCDLMMPEMDGFEVLEELNKIGNNSLFLFLTADVQDHTRDKALQLGARDVINKPLTEESLREVFEKYGV